MLYTFFFFAELPGHLVTSQVQCTYVAPLTVPSSSNSINLQALWLLLPQAALTIITVMSDCPSAPKSSLPQPPGQPHFLRHTGTAKKCLGLGGQISYFIGRTFVFRNKYEVPNIQVDSPVGLYNCPQQRTSQAFSSMDDLDAMAAGSSGLGGSGPAGSATHFSYQQASAVLSPQHHSSPHR